MTVTSEGRLPAATEAGLKTAVAPGGSPVQVKLTGPARAPTATTAWSRIRSRHRLNWPRRRRSSAGPGWVRGGTGRCRSAWTFALKTLLGEAQAAKTLPEDADVDDLLAYVAERLEEGLRRPGSWEAQVVGSLFGL